MLLHLLLGLVVAVLPGAEALAQDKFLVVVDDTKKVYQWDFTTFAAPTTVNNVNSILIDYLSVDWAPGGWLIVKAITKDLPSIHYFIVNSTNGELHNETTMSLDYVFSGHTIASVYPYDVGNGDIYVLTTDGILWNANYKTNNTKQIYPCVSCGKVNVRQFQFILTKKLLYFIEYNGTETYLKCYNTTDNSILNTKKLNNPVDKFKIDFKTNEIYAVAYNILYSVMINETSSPINLKLIYTANSLITSLALSDSYIFLATSNHSLVRLDRTSPQSPATIVSSASFNNILALAVYDNSSKPFSKDTNTTTCSSSTLQTSLTIVVVTVFAGIINAGFVI